MNGVHTLNPAEQRRHRAKEQSFWGGQVGKGSLMGNLGRVGRASQDQGMGRTESQVWRGEPMGWRVARVILSIARGWVWRQSDGCGSTVYIEEAAGDGRCCRAESSGVTWIETGDDPSCHVLSNLQH